MKILIFGFKPYFGYKENITEKVVSRLKKRKNLHKIVWPVKFDRKVFREAIEKYKPDVILGLGQHPKAHKIRIERRAVNLKRIDEKRKPTEIEKKNPRYRLVNLKLTSDRNARVVYDAGDYACNFCMYIISGIAQSKNIKFAFLHIPKDYNIRKAVKFVESKINTIS